VGGWAVPAFLFVIMFGHFHVCLVVIAFRGEGRRSELEARTHIHPTRSHFDSADPHTHGDIAGGGCCWVGHSSFGVDPFSKDLEGAARVASDALR
jgi:hypothetical protein